jgi:hypothetical protein
VIAVFMRVSLAPFGHHDTNGSDHRIRRNRLMAPTVRRNQAA